MEIYLNNNLHQECTENLETGIELINNLGDQGFYLEAVAVNDNLYYSNFEEIITENYPNINLFFWDIVQLRLQYQSTLNHIHAKIQDLLIALDISIFKDYALDDQIFEQLLVQVGNYTDHLIRAASLDNQLDLINLNEVNESMFRINHMIVKQDYVALSDILNSQFMQVLNQLNRSVNKGGNII